MVDTIVVVDDAEEVRRVVEVSLQRGGGFNVLGAADGESGLALVRAHHPVLVLCDVMMPHMTGPEMLTLLRADHTLDDVPLVFMSAVYGPEQIAELATSGAIGVISKPFRPTQLVAQIRAFLQQEKTRA